MALEHLGCGLSINHYICQKSFMEIHETIKKLREDKHFSQDAIAHALGLKQSQYSCRENGEIKFAAEEIPVLAKELGCTTAKIYGEETNSFSVHTQNGGNFGQYVSVPEKLIEQYESRLKEKEEVIAFLRSKEQGEMIYR